MVEIFPMHKIIRNPPCVWNARTPPKNSLLLILRKRMFLFLLFFRSAKGCSLNECAPSSFREILVQFSVMSHPFINECLVQEEKSWNIFIEKEFQVGNKSKVSVQRKCRLKKGLIFFKERALSSWRKIMRMEEWNLLIFLKKLIKGL